MLIKFLDDYEEIILLCAKHNYTKKQTEEVLAALETQRHLKQKQMPRTKELNQVIRAVYRAKSDDEEGGDEDDENLISYLWISESGSCSACNELDGQIFDEIPERPHLNCKCEIKEIDEDGANDKKAKHKEYIDKRNKAVDHLDKNAKLKYDGNGQCAEYTTNSLRAGGINLRQHQNTEDPDYFRAYRYGEYLEKEKFKPVYEKTNESKNLQPDKSFLKLGDTIIMQPIDEHKNGHMAMWNGDNWISDFKQNSMFIWKDTDPKDIEYTIYRNPNWQDWKRDN